MLDNNECQWCGRPCEDEIYCRVCKKHLKEAERQRQRRERMKQIKSSVWRGKPKDDESGSSARCCGQERKMMARLIEPSGIPGIIVTVEHAVAYCAAHPGWTWEYCDED